MKKTGLLLLVLVLANTKPVFQNGSNLSNLFDYWFCMEQAASGLPTTTPQSDVAQLLPTPPDAVEEQGEASKPTGKRKARRQRKQLDDQAASATILNPDLSPAEPYQHHQAAFSALSYKGLLAEVEQHRSYLKNRYQRAASATERDIILDDADALFTNALANHVLPEWYGTPWDFYGHTDIPKRGFVACGYLVSTALDHMHVNVNRYALAQQWPYNIVQSLGSDNRHQYYSREDLLNAVSGMGYGIYVLGLDKHVGFVNHTPSGTYFVHSNYAGTRNVLAEPLEQSTAFHQSFNFYLTKLSGSREFFAHWLQGDEIRVFRN